MLMASPVSFRPFPRAPALSEVDWGRGGDPGLRALGGPPTPNEPILVNPSSAGRSRESGDDEIVSHSLSLSFPNPPRVAGNVVVVILLFLCCSHWPFALTALGPFWGKGT